MLNPRTSMCSVFLSCLCHGVLMSYLCAEYVMSSEMEQLSVLPEAIQTAWDSLTGASRQPTATMTRATEQCNPSLILIPYRFRAEEHRALHYRLYTLPLFHICNNKGISVPDRYVPYGKGKKNLFYFKDTFTGWETPQRARHRRTAQVVISQS